MNEVDTPQLIIALCGREFESYRDVILEALCNRDITTTCDTSNSDGDGKKSNSDASDSSSGHISDDDLNTLYKFNLDIIDQYVKRIVELAENSGKSISSSSSSSLTSSMSNCTINLVCSLLCNLTIDESLAGKFMAFLNQENDLGHLVAFKSAVAHFLSHSVQTEPLECDDWVVVDPLQHLASICCNIARIADGRRILLHVGDGYLQRLADQIKSCNNVRARGCIAAIRTCLFDESIHWWVLNEVKLLPSLLHLLAGNTSTPYTVAERALIDPFVVAVSPQYSYDDEVSMSRKNQEIIKKLLDRGDIFTMILESILLLCQTRTSREYLRKSKVYVIVRNFDAFLQVDDEAEAAQKSSGGGGSGGGKPASVFGGFVTASATDKEDDEASKPMTPIATIKDALSNIVYEIINFMARDDDPEITTHGPGSGRATSGTSTTASGGSEAPAASSDSSPRKEMIKEAVNAFSSNSNIDEVD